MIDLIEIRGEHLDSEGYYNSRSDKGKSYEGVYNLNIIKGLEKYYCDKFEKTIYKLLFIDTYGDVIDLNKSGYHHVKEFLYSVRDGNPILLHQ